MAKEYLSQEDDSYHIDKKNFIVPLSESERDLLIKYGNLNCVVIKNWPSFEDKSNNFVTSISIDYWKLIQEKTLIKSACKVVNSFEEVLRLLKSKKADVVLVSTMTDVFSKYGKFSKSYLSYPIAIAVQKNKEYISDMSFFSGKKVAVAKNYILYEFLKNKYPDVKFIEVKNDYQGLKLLSKGEVYAVMDILPVLSFLINHYGFNNIKISGISESNFDVSLMIRNELSKLIPIINKGIDNISKKEEQDIKNKWLSIKYENIVDNTNFWKIIIISVIVISILVYRQYMLNKLNKKLQEANEKIEEKSKELRKQKELFEKIYYESSDGICLYDLDEKRIVDSNDVAFIIFGYKNKEIFLEQKLEDLLPEFQPNGQKSMEVIHKVFKICFLQGSHYFEMLHLKFDGTEIWLELVATFLVIDGKNILHIGLRDISHRKKMEEKLNILTHRLEERVQEEIKKNEEKTKQLIQQSRLAQMGEMISMIAHQWRQPLTAISATTSNILLRLMLGDKISNKELEREINLIINYSEHLSTTIDDFRNFFKKDKQKIRITLEEIIGNSVSIMKSSLDSKYIKLVLDFNCNEKVDLYANELSQVILNIIKNAEDALLENKVENPLIKIETYLRNNWAVILISDNAGGISPTIVDRIFEPYFSTKKAKEGTGIGLYMSKIIIEENCKGSLTVSNNEEGAVFEIKFKLNKKRG